MGYRSEVKISTTDKGYEYMQRRVDELTQDEEKYAQMIGKNTSPEFIEHYGDCVVFGWDWIKWYSTYSEISNIETALHELEDEGIPYQFIRVGENWEDIEFEDGDYNGRLTARIVPETTINIWV